VPKIFVKKLSSHLLDPASAPYDSFAFSAAKRLKLEDAAGDMGRPDIRGDPFWLMREFLAVILVACVCVCIVCVYCSVCCSVLHVCVARVCCTCVLHVCVAVKCAREDVLAGAEVLLWRLS